jgi:hypothetical protein
LLQSVIHQRYVQTPAARKPSPAPARPGPPRQAPWWAAPRCGDVFSAKSHALSVATTDLRLLANPLSAAPAGGIRSVSAAPARNRCASKNWWCQRAADAPVNPTQPASRARCQAVVAAPPTSRHEAAQPKNEVRTRHLKTHPSALEHRKEWGVISHFPPLAKK